MSFSFNIFIYVIYYFIYILVVLLTVAFYTLLERKIIGLIHQRLGPNKLSFLGLLQPLIDAFKLLSKSYVIPYHSNVLPYILSPYVSLLLSLLLWVFVVPRFFFISNTSVSILCFSCITSMIVLPVITRGWSSNSKYSFIGSLRSVAQSISYEAVLSTLIVLVICFSSTYSFLRVSNLSSSFMIYLFYIWLFCSLAESHRAPFDFAERERELVSGYNTEYIGALFAFTFLAEYSTVLVSCYVIVLLFFFFSSFHFVYTPLLTLILSILLVIIRVTYCRFRYDLLMLAAWKSYLPCSLFLIYLYLLLSFF